MNTGQARLQALAAALLFSTGGAGIKVAAFSGLQVSALRSGIAAVALLVFLRGRLVWSRQVVAGWRRLRGHGHAVRVVDETDDVPRTRSFCSRRPRSICSCSDRCCLANTSGAAISCTWWPWRSGCSVASWGGRRRASPRPIRRWETLLGGDVQHHVGVHAGRPSLHRTRPLTTRPWNVRRRTGECLRVGRRFAVRMALSCSVDWRVGDDRLPRRRVRSDWPTCA